MFDYAASNKEENGVWINQSFIFFPTNLAMEETTANDRPQTGNKKEVRTIFHLIFCTVCSVALMSYL